MANELRGPLPVKVDATSNGEFRPVPLTEQVTRANSEAELRIGEHAKRVGLGRRAFLQSLCGAATTLLTLNEAFAALDNIGGLFRLPKESAFACSGRRSAVDRVVAAAGALREVGEDLLPIPAGGAAPCASRVDHVSLHVEDELVAG